MRAVMCSLDAAPCNPSWVYLGDKTDFETLFCEEYDALTLCDPYRPSAQRCEQSIFVFLYYVSQSPAGAVRFFQHGGSISSVESEGDKSSMRDIGRERDKRLVALDPFLPPLVLPFTWHTSKTTSDEILPI